MHLLKAPMELNEATFFVFLARFQWIAQPAPLGTVCLYNGVS